MEGERRGASHDCSSTTTSTGIVVARRPRWRGDLAARLHSRSGATTLGEGAGPVAHKW
jgi:hypothetical protein